MSAEDSFERTLASLHSAALGGAPCLSAAALVNETVATGGHALLLTRGRTHEGQLFFFRFCFGRERREDWERIYLRDYRDRDERTTRIARQPDGALVHTPALFSDEERKSSAVYNGLMSEMGAQDGLNVRLDGPGGTNVVWVLADSARKGGWSSDQVAMVERLAPHIRHFVSVRHALVEAGALGASLHRLLDNSRICVIELDRLGKIVAANGPACHILRQRDPLFAPGGFLRATRMEENVALQRMLAGAMPQFGDRGVGGSMAIRGSSSTRTWIVHIQPVGEELKDVLTRRVAALVLAVCPALPVWMDPYLVAMAFDFTDSESRLASMLAAGYTVRDIAAATGRTRGTVHWHLNQIFRKLGITRQAELVRRVLSLRLLSEDPPEPDSVDNLGRG